MKSLFLNNTKPLDYDGERFVPGADPDSETLHFHRYLALLDIVKNKDVLDIASGEGFGSWFLQQSALSVVGVDVSAKAVDHAQRRYGNDRLRFVIGDCSAIPLLDQSVDVVVSFETIEHIEDHDGFLAEVRRVMRPGGLFVVSTPDKDGYGASMDVSNPFHVNELTHEEFHNLLAANFSNIAFYDQGLKLVSILWPQDHEKNDNRMLIQPWIDLTKGAVESRATMPNAVIQIAVASNAALPPLGGMLQQFPYAFPISAIAGGAGERVVERMLRQISAEPELVNLPLKDYPATSGSPAEKAAAIVTYLAAALKFDRGAKRAAMEADRISERELLETDFAFERDDMVAEIKFLDQQVLEKSSLLSVTMSHQYKQFIRKLRRKRSFYKFAASVTYGRHSIKMLAKIAKYNLLISQVKQWNLEKKYASDLIRSLGRARPKAVVIVGPVDVSIIIPVYNQIEYTIGCLRSLISHKTKSRIEIIVVDDGSTDETQNTLKAIRWIKYIRQPINGGFIKSCNAGAKAALGKYVLFLNNDTEVLEGWLDELVQTFETFPNAGLVGSKLLYPDGRLQEAGGIIWRDGSAWNFGHGQNPLRPEFCYARKVDYCSGASIMVPGALFDEMGGFDSYYAPAYCEDSDLAMRLRAVGRDVIYQPLSKLMHFEGVTSGTDVGRGIKSYQVENSKKLFERWQSKLKLRPDNGHGPDNAKDFGIGKRLLVIDSITPAPDQDAGSVTCMEIMRAAQSLGYQVTFIPESNYEDLANYTPALQRMGIEALYAPFVKDVKLHLTEHGHRYDALIVFRVNILKRWYEDIREFAPQARLIYQTSDLHHLREMRQGQLSNDAAKIVAAAETKIDELELVRASECTLVHSTFERDYLIGQIPDAQIEVFNWILDPKGTEVPFVRRTGIMFLGGYRHTPNVDAVNYYLDEIWPLVLERLPDAVFYVVGSNLPDSLRERASKSVVMVGYIDDLRQIMDRCRLSVVPLRFGAGTKGKLAMSLAYGLPAVTTSIGAEGMGLIDGDCVYVCDSPISFCDKIVSLYQDEEAWNRMSENSIRYVVESLSRQAGTEVIRRALEVK